MKIELNKIQKEAAKELKEDVVLMAGAGTGKTQVLTNRFLNILKSNEKLENILAITFTKKAAADMKRKIKNAILESDDEVLKESYKYFSKASIYTIHGFCSEIISKNPTIAGIDTGYMILESQDTEKLLVESIKKVIKNNLKSDVLHEILVETKRITTEFIERELLNTYYDIKNLGYSIDDLRLKTQNTISSMAKTDFSNLIELLNEYEKNLNGRNKFKIFYLQPEFQDFLKNPEIDFLSEIKNNLGTSKGSEEILKDIKLEIQRLELNLEHKNEKYVELVSELLKQVEIEFKKSKQNLNALDYDDLQEYAIKVLEEIKTNYNYVMVDEFQDTNHTQVRILDLLKEKNKKLNLFVVGDPKQSIYSFRGGSIETYYNYIDKMQKQGAKVLELSENYRSSKRLIDGFNCIFEDLMGEKYSALNANIEGVESIKIIDYEEEIEATAQKVQELIENGVSPNEIALLYRKKTKMEEMEKELLRRGISVSNTATIFGKNREVRDVLILLKVLSHEQDIINHLAYLKTPEVGLSENAIFLLANEHVKYGEWGLDFINILDPMDQKKFFYGQEKLNTLKYYKDVLNLSDLIKKILEELKFYEVAYYFRGLVAQNNLNQLLIYAKNYENLYGTDLDGFIEYIENLQIEDEPSNTAVNLITTHKSKGLEYDYVFLMGCNDSFRMKDNSYLIKIGEFGIGFNIGNRNSIYNLNKQILDIKQFEEEIRIFYVGCTRAKHSLTFVQNTVVAKMLEHSYANLISNSSFDDLENINLEIKNKILDTKSHILNSDIKNEALLKDKTLIRERYYAKKANGNYYSVSQFMTYRNSKEEYFNKYVLGKEVESKFGGIIGEIDPIIRGNIIHKFAEVQPENIDEFLKYQFKKYGVEESLESFDEIKTLIENYKLYDENILQREWEFYLNLEEAIVHGFIDQVIKTESGIEVVDLKTGVINKEKLDYYSVQLQIYAYAYEKITNKKVNSAKIVSIGERKEYNINISKEAIDKTISEFRSFIKEVQNLR